MVKIFQLIALISITTLITSCGKDQIEEAKTKVKYKDRVVENANPEIDSFKNRSGCNILYPQALEDILAAIQCEGEEQLLLYTDGSLIEDGSIRIIEDTYTCYSTELLLNGSFEEGHDLGNNKWGVFDAIFGWYADLSIVNAPIEIQNGQRIGSIAPSHGDAKLELDSHKKSGYTANDAVVVQDVSTDEGVIYNLSFDYSVRISNNIHTNVVEVYWNGSKIAHLNNNKKGWESFNISVVGVDGFSRLEFRAKEDNNSYGGYIDNVSLKEVCN